MPQQSGAGSGGGPVGFSPSALPGVMQAMQQIMQGGQMLAQALPPVAPFIAQFLTQLQQAVPDTIMAASGQGGQGQPGAGPQQTGGSPAMGGSMSAPPSPAPVGM